MREARQHHRASPPAFTLAEIMISMMIFAMVATAGTYLMGAATKSQSFFRDGTSTQSEVEFALGRMVENLRAATAVTSPTSTSAVSTLTLTNLSGVSVSYAWNSAAETLTETVGSSSNTLVTGVTGFSVMEYSTTVPKAFTITLSAGTDEAITRQVDVFGRNL